ncbi:ribbon-helix-helix domain-containing protein [Propionimicrobium lymphophilum]|uniref:ribbon-helix-helix domain-containing protein n=1 Tax=Propionimicrobium lymphophilum TaxID=33012 RepID=UPI0003F94137|nr:ribbon-helix-helix domain-containing protein [Propionimicrobium lymphophilum]
MNSFTAINGQVVSDEMLEKLESTYASGEFPDGESAASDVIQGSPRALSPEGTAVLSVKVPVAMKRAIQEKAEKGNMTPSELVRSMIARELIEA